MLRAGASEPRARALSVHDLFEQRAVCPLLFGKDMSNTTMLVLMSGLFLGCMVGDPPDEMGQGATPPIVPAAGAYCTPVQPATSPGIALALTGAYKTATATYASSGVTDCTLTTLWQGVPYTSQAIAPNTGGCLFGKSYTSWSFTCEVVVDGQVTWSDTQTVAPTGRR